MSKKRILYGVVFALSLGVSCQSYAQTSEGLSQTPPSTSPTDCADEEKKASRDSSCLLFSITTAAKEHKASQMGNSKINPFSVLGLSCTTPWGETVADGSAVSAFFVPNGSFNYGTKEWATECLEENRYCINGTLSGSYQHKSCELQPVDAQCGSAYGQYYTFPTSGPSNSNLCNPEFTYGGTPPANDNPPSTPAYSSVFLNGVTNVYSWTCDGEAGGASKSCLAFRRINGQCGTSIDQCSLGNSANPTASNNYNPNYLCNCSTVAGVTTCTASPTGTQTCAGGYKDTTYAWECTGINTGTTASCSATGYDPSQASPTPPPPPPPPPPPSGCPWIHGIAASGTVTDKCNIAGIGPNPIGQQFTCGAGDTWYETNVGDPSILIHCL